MSRVWFLLLERIFSHFHYDIDNKEYNRKLVKQRQLLQSPCNKKNIQNLDSYDDLISTLTRPDLEKITAVILIDELLRHKLGKLHTLKLIQQITSPSMIVMLMESPKVP
jgi:hypothetical protein